MKKSISFTMAMVFLLFIAAAARAQVEGDRITEGKQVMEKGKLLTDEGQMLKDVKTPDRAWLVDKGHMMIKQGINITEDGEMMYTGEGSSNMQEIGIKLRQSGGKLLKMGREKGELTQKDKDSLVKEGGIMMDLGKLMFEKGKFMAGE
jgi:hypothetical protein